MMRKVFTLLGVLMLTSSLAWGQAISSSKHDFTSGTGATPYNFASGKCITCHVPHSSVSTAPLWNHTTDATGYTMYASATINGAQQAAPALVSLACLGCHDGVTAVDAYGGSAGTGILVGTNTPAAVVGKNLSQDHPVSITYGTPAGDFNAAASGMVGGALPLYGPSTTKDQVECGSCHNPHDPTPSGVTPAAKFLRQSEGTICTTCHIK